MPIRPFPWRRDVDNRVRINFWGLGINDFHNARSQLFALGVMMDGVPELRAAAQSQLSLHVASLLRRNG